MIDRQYTEAGLRWGAGRADALNPAYRTMVLKGS